MRLTGARSRGDGGDGGTPTWSSISTTDRAPGRRPSQPWHAEQLQQQQRWLRRRFRTDRARDSGWRTPILPWLPSPLWCWAACASIAAGGPKALAALSQQQHQQQQQCSGLMSALLTLRERAAAASATLYNSRRSSPSAAASGQRQIHQQQQQQQQDKEEEDKEEEEQEQEKEEDKEEEEAAGAEPGGARAMVMERVGCRASSWRGNRRKTKRETMSEKWPHVWAIMLPPVLVCFFVSYIPPSPVIHLLH